MILSRRHGFVFIKGMKVAGTSVEMALSTLCGPDDIVTPISPVDELARLAMGGAPRNWIGDRAAEAAYLDRVRAAGPADIGEVRVAEGGYRAHMPLSEVVERQGDLAAFRIAFVVRSPYAKAISWANHRLSGAAYAATGRMRNDLEGLREEVDRRLADGDLLNCLNIGRYRWPDGGLAGPPLRYETLAADFAGFVESLGVDAVPQLPHAKRGLLSDDLDPRRILGPRQIAGINEMFAEEFEAFGYSRLG